jgi:hypothetical protein
MFSCKHSKKDVVAFRVDPSIEKQYRNDSSNAGFEFNNIIDGDTETSLRSSPVKVDASFGLFEDSMRLFIVGNDGFAPKAFWWNFSRKAANPFFFACGHSRPVYSSRPEGDTSQCMQLTLPSYELIISRLPDTISDAPIYGWLNVSTPTYYSIDNKGAKIQSTFRGYFVAKRWDVLP